MEVTNVAAGQVTAMRDSSPLPLRAGLDEATDRDLIDRVAAGDRDALAAVYRRHGGALYAYLVHLVEDRSLAEEILQDTLVAAWKGAGSFEGRSSLLTWLVGIARRQAHNNGRRRVLPRADVGELETVPAADPEPEDAALAQATREELAAAMARLSPLHREVLVLAFVHGLSYEEMARTIGVPIGTIKSRLSNAKTALRGLLERGEAER
jgi:RNA polymerase sigma-70 factor (ECF subfamily)